MIVNMIWSWFTQKGTHSVVIAFIRTVVTHAIDCITVFNLQCSCLANFCADFCQILDGHWHISPLLVILQEPSASHQITWILPRYEYSLSQLFTNVNGHRVITVVLLGD